MSPGPCSERIERRELVVILQIALGACQRERIAQCLWRRRRPRSMGVHVGRDKVAERFRQLFNLPGELFLRRWRQLLDMLEGSVQSLDHAPPPFELSLAARCRG